MAAFQRSYLRCSLGLQATRGSRVRLKFQTKLPGGRLQKCCTQENFTNSLILARVPKKAKSQWDFGELFPVEETNAESNKAESSKSGGGEEESQSLLTSAPTGD